MESAVSRFYPSPNLYRLPGPKAIVVGIDASRVGLGIFTFYSREDSTREDATYSSARDVLHLRTTIKMQWRHNCVTSTQTWLGNWLYTPSSHDGASRKFAPMPSAVVIVVVNATPLSLHDI